MADTQRTLTELQALLADNNSKNISPQDVRDWLVSSHLRNCTTTALNYSATASDFNIILDASNSAIALTLPTCTAGNAGQIFSVKAINAGTNKPYITNNVDGAAWTFQSSWDSIDMFSNGINWRIAGARIAPIIKQTNPATIAFTTANTFTVANETIVINRPCIAEFSFNAHWVGATYTAGDYPARCQIKVNGTLVGENYLTLNLSTNVAMAFPFNINALVTLPAGTNTITAHVYNANKWQMPGSLTTLKYKLYF